MVAVIKYPFFGAGIKNSSSSFISLSFLSFYFFTNTTSMVFLMGAFLLTSLRITQKIIGLFCNCFGVTNNLKLCIDLAVTSS